jgi:hypothetical protein
MAEIDENRQLCLKINSKFEGRRKRDKKKSKKQLLQVRLELTTPA